MNKNPNRLIKEKSPYLLQHAYNPVDWYPWSEEAFNKAEKENKPIFLSIGYSTCHWCHVMEKESFEDETVARLMNETFISIKVDREERPDIDNIYMTVCQMLTGGGGWPLTVILTPDKKPFITGTYFPRDSNYGRVGMLELVPRVKELWQNRQQDILNSVDEIINSLKHSSHFESGAEPDEEILHLAFKQLSDKFDKEHGGFSNAPKFPTPHNLLFLLRYWKRTKNSSALEMVEKTLNEMKRGGIYDHVGFGFHRYSTDRNWLVPHFEKMLYDQALLTISYSEAFQVTRNNEYKKTVYEILEYVERELTSPEGGFYSAEDADSEGEEGKFYFWKKKYIEKILGKDAELFCKVFNISEGGNFHEQFKQEYSGDNILHLTKSSDEIATELNLPAKEFNDRIIGLLKLLFVNRDARVHPFKDDKILTDWNGLMIAAFAKAASVFDEIKYSLLARKAADFIINKMYANDGKLLHRYRENEAGIDGNLEDYSFFIFGLIELYLATFEISYLQKALKCNEYFLEHFIDEINGGFYFSSDESEDLLVRMKDINDGAIPSGNSVAIINLVRLSKLTGNNDFLKIAQSASKAFHQQISSNPFWHTAALCGIDLLLSESTEIVLTEGYNSSAKEMIEAANSSFNPNQVILLKIPANKIDVELIAPFTSNMNIEEGKTIAYVCKNFVCNLPVEATKKMLELISDRT